MYAKLFEVKKWLNMNSKQDKEYGFGRKWQLNHRKPKTAKGQGLQPNCDQVCVLLKIILILPILGDIIWNYNKKRVVNMA